MLIWHSFHKTNIKYSPPVYNLPCTFGSLSMQILKSMAFRAWPPNWGIACISIRKRLRKSSKPFKRAIIQISLPFQWLPFAVTYILVKWSKQDYLMRTTTLALMLTETKRNFFRKTYVFMNFLCSFCSAHDIEFAFLIERLWMINSGFLVCEYHVEYICYLFTLFRK